VLRVSDVEVVEAASSTDFTTLSQVKERLSITDTSHDSLLSNLITEFSARIESYTGRVFPRERVREYLQPTRSPYLALSRTPVREVHSVALDGEVIEGWELRDPEAGFLHRDRGWPSREAGAPLWWSSRGFSSYHDSPRYTVEYSAGYLMPGETGRDLPHDLEAAAIEMVVGAFQGAGRDPAIERESIGNVSVTYGDASATSPATFLRVLERYRRVA